METLSYIFILLLVVIVLGLVLTPTAFGAVMQSATYRISADSINVGGTDSGSSASYVAKDTVGEAGTGLLTGVLYALKAGYRQLVNVIPSSDDSGSGSAASSVGGNGPVGGLGGSGIIALAVSSIKIERGSDSAAVSWRTNVPATSIISWGEDLKYEGGTLRTTLATLTHHFTIPNLVKSQVYYFKFESADSNNQRAGLTGEVLISTPTLDITPPANPKDVSILAEGKAIKLDWQNPVDADFKEIIIIRSESFYPKDISDGVLIYRGIGESALDQNIEADTNYFYSIFASDAANNYSSGALISGRIEISAEVPIVVTPNIFDALPKSTEVDPRFNRVDFSNFQIIQGNRLINSGLDALVIDGSAPFRIAADYDSLPEVLKTILITIKNIEMPEREFSFLLRANRGFTAYEASIGALGEAGNYQMRIAIIDHDNQAIKTIDGKLTAVYPLSKFISDRLEATVHKVWPNVLPSEVGIVVLMMLFLVGLGRTLLLII